jgi:hypothetical protein
MPPPILTDLPPPPPIEHVYMVDVNGEVVEVQGIIPLAPIQSDFQPSLFRKRFSELTPEELDRIVDIVESLPESFRKQTKKLFAEVGEIKKQNYQLHLKNQALQEQIDFLYHELNIQKRGFNDLCNFCPD